jgi:mRNA interferase RelE/StbE
VAKYSLEIKQSAQKELDALDETQFTRIDCRILALADNPRPAGCKKLKGYKDHRRIRAGDWRLRYIIDDSAKIVAVTRIAHRRAVYECLHPGDQIMRFLIMLEQTETGFAVQVPDLAITTYGEDIEAAKRAAGEAIQSNLE